ncbi:autotransporter strand-loop-strand O-heptosyltransferase [Paraburkholderia sp. J41]|uniref:autotransporter strand-loop-strand O-heptosyltransferase n=1 Tax=Paraburkholderia sp. J41 TaxID=2805433 RepID=UPI002AC33313|nr:autotransporter strand-loop-strand O-heptosyltransferase [Paraburkholderia sp. J41]
MNSSIGGSSLPTLQPANACAAYAQRGVHTASFAQLGAPVLPGPEGIRFDFNYGCRVQVPRDGWRVRMRDLDTGNVVFDAALQADEVAASRRKYFVRFLLEVMEGDRLVFSHAFDAKGRRVRIEVGSGAMGDAIAWMPAFEAFRRQHGCALTVRMQDWLSPLFEAGYPSIDFVGSDEAGGEEPVYATYRVGCYKPFADRDHQPTDMRVSNLQDFASYMLGVPAIERRPRVASANPARVIEGRYVCIATQASAQCKYWNYPGGWYRLVEHLKSRGYRVLCIDRDRESASQEAVNVMPSNAEDFTGALPLQQRASLLANADFFVGLGSGLSWLAWSVQTPVVLISGFSHPKAEFHTPWRIINFHACNSCYNDTQFEFDDGDHGWCPRHAGDALRFQCTKAITPEHVIRVVDQLIDAQLASRRNPDE